jgi:hypothetical protein
MHWYYRVDRTNNRYCWYLQSAGLQVRSHEIVPVSNPRPQIVAEQSRASPQLDSTTSPSQEPIGAPSTHFTARWLDLPASIDLGTYDFATARSDYAGEHASPHSEEPMLSARAAASETISQLPHKSTNVLKFGSLFVAGAISVVLFVGLFKGVGVSLGS